MKIVKYNDGTGVRVYLVGTEGRKWAQTLCYQSNAIRASKTDKTDLERHSAPAGVAPALFARHCILAADRYAIPVTKEAALMLREALKWQ